MLAGSPVLDNVSFTIRSGQFTGLIGSNGAGKTTLLRVILGLQAPTHGHVSLSAGASRRGGLGYVPQKFLLDPDMPVRARDLVALGLDGHRLGPGRPSRARRQRVDAMLEAVDARSFADARVGRLSGGEQQRILIAHALVSEPKLLLLDEPLASLDLRSGQEVVSLLARIGREREIAILISAHEMNPLLPVMERIVYLAAGHAASGPTDAVVRSDVLTKLYGHHVDVLRIHGRVLVVAATSGDDQAELEHRFKGSAVEIV
ncbi:MAG: metal ABC transporter ATP-binding protein [Solirubrobacteraceae bacterium]